MQAEVSGSLAAYLESLDLSAAQDSLYMVRVHAKNNGDF